MKWRQKLSVGALIGGTIICSAFAFLLGYLDNRFGPYRLSQGLSKVLLSPLVLVFGCLFVVFFFFQSKSATRNPSGIVRAQSIGLLIFGLILGGGLIVNYTPEFIEGIQILNGTSPVKTGYQSADDLRKAYERAYSARDGHTFKRRIYSVSYQRKAGLTSVEKILDALPQHKPQKFSWDWENYSTKGIFTVVISDGVTPITMQLEFTKIDYEGWKVTDVR